MLKQRFAFGGGNGLQGSSKMHSVKKLLVALLLGLGFIAASGCETAEGFGRDVEKAGEGIQEEARDAD
jgi:predicted small secreted protein